VATPAGLANVSRTYGGSRFGVLDDPVLAVAIRAERRIGDSAGQGLPMNALAKLVYDFGVAGPASVQRGRPKCGRLRIEQLVRAAVTYTAVGRCFVSGAAGLTVNSAGIVACLLCMASRANRFQNVFRMGKCVVIFVAGLAT
jgi:hypothetical protein